MTDPARPGDGATASPPAREAPGRVLMIFLDGVGIGPDDPERNPFARAKIPTLLTLTGEATVVPLDATLGVAGTPQSGTGQAALLTGTNAAATFGGHFGPWTPVRLRPLVEERSLLRRAVEAGRSVAFANAYPRGWPGPGGSRRIAGPPLAARGAGVLDRHEEALAEGRAVSSEILNDGWKRHLGHAGLPDVTPERAGTNLAAIASGHDLTLYAHYATDTAGHRGRMEGAVAALERVDRFLAGVMDALPPGCTLVVASDHGNIEDVTMGHTLNPALGVLHGPGAGTMASGMRDLTDVAPAILRWIGVEP